MSNDSKKKKRSKRGAVSKREGEPELKLTSPRKGAASVAHTSDEPKRKSVDNVRPFAVKERSSEAEKRAPSAVKSAAAEDKGTAAEAKRSPAAVKRSPAAPKKRRKAGSAAKRKPSPAAPKRAKAEKKKVKRAPIRLSKKQTAGFIAVLAILCLGAFCVVMFFVTKVSTIEVTGNSRYSANEIINRSGLYTGKNLLTYDLGEAKKRLETDPYIRCIGVRRIFPSTIGIEIEERKEFAAVQMSGDNYCIIDRTGYILTIGRRESLDGLIPIYGLSTMGFSTGTYIDMDKTKLRPYVIMEIIEAIGDRSFEIGSIDISNSSNVRITTPDGITVMLGDSVDIPHKIERMFSAIRKVDPSKASGAIIYINATGTTDLSYPTQEPLPTGTNAPEAADDPETTDEPGWTDDTGDD